MVCPPLPWVSLSTGGYLVERSSLIKIPDITPKEHMQEIFKVPAANFNPIFDSLNQLGGVAWRVNSPLLAVAQELFTSDTTCPALLHQLSLPLHPERIEAPQLGPNLAEVVEARGRFTKEQVKEYEEFINSKVAHAQVKAETYSLWCTVLYRLSLANHFKDRPIWFPHNIDFRGRCYPLPVLFNHMGDDLARSLLMFEVCKPLGEGGLDWLLLHCINLTGLKKRESVAERLEYARSVLPQILDSAAQPLAGDRWWLESETPWQTLATCLEVAGALAHPGGPAAYASHLPIHQDGSCNGLQHYAALGRDTLGARAVNLVPQERPGDVYSEIAEIVERKRGEDAKKNTLAANLAGVVKRKVIKQTVMTTVYGVTGYGATKQIARQLKDLETVPLDVVGPGSKYLSKKTFESLNELFEASQEIQEWLTKCAVVISKDVGENVSWVTPLGLPVVQPYNTLSRPPKAITPKNLFNISLQRSYVPVKKLGTVKHKNGFAPNFIHSLDASHMMLTSLHLWSRGVAFASVHDCYWTHASDVETMNAVCREQFVKLHSYPILEKLSEHFVDKFANDDSAAGLNPVEAQRREQLFKNVPSKGDLDLNVVRDSVYFFS